jgi:hypothetical protein
MEKPNKQSKKYWINEKTLNVWSYALDLEKYIKFLEKQNKALSQHDVSGAVCKHPIEYRYRGFRLKCQKCNEIL